jgi:maltooligosyltrehalose trehalohydrolase
VPDPCALTTFLSSKLNLGERASHAAEYALHRDLLGLRREDAVLSRQSRTDLDGAVMGDHALVIRFFGGELGDRLLAVNLGTDVDLTPWPEPLLAPPDGGWSLLFSTDDPRYGGPGAVGEWRPDHFRLPGGSAQLYAATRGEI